MKFFLQILYIKGGFMSIHGKSQKNLSDFLAIYGHFEIFLKKSEIFFKKRLTNLKRCDIINIVVRGKTVNGAVRKTCEDSVRLAE